MSKVLAILDDRTFVSGLEEEFRLRGIECTIKSLKAAIKDGSGSLAHDKIVVFVDAGFHIRYGGVLHEMGPFFNNLARKAWLYLVFENLYESGFRSWLQDSRRVIELKSGALPLSEAIEAIAAESRWVTTFTDFVSPMR
jgi:hypothetical protein